MFLSISTCVANNPIIINGSLTIQGCQDLPTTCTARKSSENCEIQRIGFPLCLWISSSKICLEQSCATASIVGTTGSLSIFNFSNFQNYLTECTATNALGSCIATSKPCISNNTSDGCMLKPSICSGLVQSNCQLGSKVIGDCYWNGSSCVDRTCSNIKQTTHENCFSKFDQCTVNNEGNACQPLATACTAYTIQENCKITSKNKNCAWTGLTCRNATCADAPDKASYDSDTKCQAYLTASQTCTVVQKVGGQGCVSRSTSCTDYMTQAQCHKTISNLTVNDDCKWIIDKCYTVTTGSCTTFKGTQSICEGYKAGCTNIVGATPLTACTLDCALKTGINLSFLDCQALDATCSVKKDGSGCIKISSSCADYALQANCFRAGTGLCGWNGSACLSITTAAECVHVSAFTGLDHAKCQGYHTSCTSLLDGTGCQEYKAKCSDYTTSNTCATSSQGKCFLDGTNCVRFSNCSSIVGTGLTDTNCEQYNVSCVANADKTACQEKISTCSLYLTQNDCTTSTAAKCVWSGSTCIVITNLSTDCALVTGDGLTDTKCAIYNSGCTVNRVGTACQEKKATCSLYNDSMSCSKSSTSCVWSGSACLVVTNLSNDCAFVTGDGLTDSKCAIYNSGCTVNRNGTACQERKATCSLYTNLTACSISSASGTAAKCVWNGLACITIVTGDLAIECTYVRGMGLTDATCGTYSTRCTANKEGYACQEKQASCSLYKDQMTCSTSSALGTAAKCVWTGSACITIQTANLATDCRYVQGMKLTDAICASYNAGCTANKEGNACQEKQASCSLYNNIVACSLSSASGTAANCVWGGSACISIETANLTTDCRYIQGMNLTDAMCSTYNVGCTVNREKNLCQEKKATCTEYLTQTTCTKSSAPGIAANCVWNGSACIIIQAGNLAIECKYVQGTGLTDELCSTYHAGCTANKIGNECQERKAICSLYANYSDCSLSSASGTAAKCVWTGSACITIEAGNLASDCRYVQVLNLTDAICATYNVGCAINKDGTTCHERKATCSVYNDYSSCTISSASGTASKCVWTGTACITITSENLALGCKYVQGINLTDEICSTYNVSCTVNPVGSSCHERKSTCADYVEHSACTQTSTTKCVWSSSGCIAISTGNLAIECRYILGMTFTDAICSSYHPGCTANKDGNFCQEKLATCAAYGGFFSNCSTSLASKCAWSGSTCVSIPTGNLAIECKYIQGIQLTDEICATYNSGCTANQAGTECQEKKDTCSAYTSSATCSTSSASGTAAKCVWTGSACGVVITLSTDCAFVKGPGLTDIICANYNVGCTANRAGTECQEKKATCSAYTASTTCSISSDSGTAAKCVWNGSACVVVINASTDCTFITGIGLTSAFCSLYNVDCTSLKDGIVNLDRDIFTNNQNK